MDVCRNQTASDGNLVLLNGAGFGGHGALLLVTNGGNLFVQNAATGWYEWNGSYFAPASGDPRATSTTGNTTGGTMGGDNISCDTGTNYSGSVPTEAQATGFTHCAANWDFSQSLYATQSNWLDCGDNDPSLIWHAGEPGTGSVACNIFQG